MNRPVIEPLEEGGYKIRWSNLMLGTTYTTRNTEAVSPRMAWLDAEAFFKGVGCTEEPDFDEE